MPYNGSGVFVRLRNWVNDATAGIRIRADRHDSEDDNFASGLSQCITKDGQTTVTANLPMANYRHTGVGAATAATHYARYDQVQIGNAVWADAGGTADAITATYNPNTVTPVDGQLYYVRAGAANATTTPTFSPDGETPQTIVKNANQPLAVGDIAGDGHELILRYRLSDTKYELLNPAVPLSIPSLAIAWTPASASGSASLAFAEDTDNGTNKVTLKAPPALASDYNFVLPIDDGASGQVLQTDGSGQTSWTDFTILNNYKSGLELSSDTDADHDILISPGVCTDSANGTYMKLVAGLTKQIDATWAEGDDAGGLFSGSVANNTWYHVFVIKKDSDGTIDAGFDTSVTAANIPSGWTSYRRIGSVRSNGSANITPFKQTGSYFKWETPVQNINTTTSTSAANITLTVPTGVKVIPSLTVTVDTSTNAFALLFSDPDQTDVAPSLTTGLGQIMDLGGDAADRANGTVTDVFTNISAQIRWRSTVASRDTDASTLGWMEIF